MTPQAKIAALRAALDNAISLIDQIDGKDNSCDQRTDISDLRSVLALTVDDAEQAPDLDDALCAVLWLYHRLPRGYERQPHIERVVKSLADATRTDGVLLLKELGRESAIPAPIAAEPAPKTWDVRMQQHYAQGKSVQCYPAIHFMQQEIDDWRARDMKGGK